MVSEASILIAPSVLSANFADLGREVRAVTDAGADLIHVDIMDGLFVPAISFGEVVVDAIRANTDVPLNIHLMIQEPETLLSTFAKVESDQILVHAEACGHLHRTVCRRSFRIHRHAWGSPPPWQSDARGASNRI